jgi:hypothetical protein
VPEARRLANAQIRRHANLSIEEVAAQFGGVGEDHVFTFFCECDRAACREMLHLSVAEYTRLGGERRYLVAPGHYDGHRDRLAATGEGVYAIEREQPATSRAAAGSAAASRVRR